MRKLFVAALLLIGPLPASAAVVDSVGLGFAPITLYARSALRDTGFPTTVYILGASNRIRVEYTQYSNDLPSRVRTRQYNNSALLAFYNMEFLLRARRGSILGRTRLYAGAGGGLFRSRLNEVSNVNENNIGWGALAGFRYFANKTFYIGAEAKYLNANITYESSNNISYGSANIGGLFFGLHLGFRFSE